MPARCERNRPIVDITVSQKKVSHFLLYLLLYLLQNLDNSDKIWYVVF